MQLYSGDKLRTVWLSLLFFRGIQTEVTSATQKVSNQAFEENIAAEPSSINYDSIYGSNGENIGLPFFKHPSSRHEYPIHLDPMRQQQPEKQSWQPEVAKAKPSPGVELAKPSPGVELAKPHLKR
eukprot:GHVS01030727.1.p1 GENE.GHVS01030727.1~~GHVS01030727.1.p1  ORF type:complete len:125 (-),score=7.84 GHVS01030727.1:346-720(-)